MQLRGAGTIFDSIGELKIIQILLITVTEKDIPQHPFLFFQLFSLASTYIAVLSQFAISIESEHVNFTEDATA